VVETGVVGVVETGEVWVRVRVIGENNKNKSRSRRERGGDTKKRLNEWLEAK
jgi:hypothetical protein